ncbi:MAG TPA: hypothetical protein VFT08_03730, partial [Pyrinomonadaceae bacterium]|nr:hypothetical protein [Pyrinomonadaceae bacterium]
FWILDDITPLRQLNATVTGSSVYLFAPQVAYRVQRNVNTDTPLPPEEPAGQNPPDGAIINYYFRQDPVLPIKLEIFDSKNQLVRRYSSDDDPVAINPNDYPVTPYWFQKRQYLAPRAGMQRFVWDLKYAPTPAYGHGFPISAIYQDTPLYPLGPSVLPGTYTVKLTANGKTFTQSLTVRIDPRVKTSPGDLTQQFNLSLQAYRGMQQTYEAADKIKKLRAQIRTAIENVGRGPLAESLANLDKKLAAIAGEGRGDGPGGGTIDVREPNLTRLNGGFSTLLEHLQSADLAPTQPMIEASFELQKVLAKLLADWENLKDTDIKAINAQLPRPNQPQLIFR